MASRESIAASRRFASAFSTLVQEVCCTRMAPRQISKAVLSFLPVPALDVVVGQQAFVGKQQRVA